MKKKLPIDISDYKELIEGNYLYVDKTEIIYELLQNKLHFLSRPRRFGKTLLISTLEQIFLGSKELFKDTWIYNSDYAWKKHPVIRFDFSRMNYSSDTAFEESFNIALNKIAAAHNHELPQAYSFTEKFLLLIEKLSETSPVAILIDEYDYPLITHINNVDKAKELQGVMQNFFTKIKAAGPLVRFCLLTGVSRFSKTSIFSGFNNLNDITLNPEFAALVGYTQKELESNFNEYVEKLAQQQNMPIEAMYNKLKEWYNGYRFSDAEIKVYNPFSIIKVLKDKKFLNYWFTTGTPSFLIKLLPQYEEKFKRLRETTFSNDTLMASFEIGQLDFNLLLYQTGYLTITNYADERYALDFPNKEVKTSFFDHILVYLTGQSKTDVNGIVYESKQALEVGNFENFTKQIRLLIANIPFHIHSPEEKYYHSLIHTFLYTLSVNLQSEKATSIGRIDTIIETKNYIYIIEYKLNKSAEIALQQIEERKYYEQFLGSKKQIVLVGININYIDKDLQVMHKIVQ